MAGACHALCRAGALTATAFVLPTEQPAGNTTTDGSSPTSKSRPRGLTTRTTVPSSRRHDHASRSTSAGHQTPKPHPNQAKQQLRALQSAAEPGAVQHAFARHDVQQHMLADPAPARRISAVMVSLPQHPGVNKYAQPARLLAKLRARPPHPSAAKRCSPRSGASGHSPCAAPAVLSGGDTQPPPLLPTSCGLWGTATSPKVPSAPALLSKHKQEGLLTRWVHPMGTVILNLQFRAYRFNTILYAITWHCLQPGALLPTSWPPPLQSQPLPHGKQGPPINLLHPSFGQHKVPRICIQAWGAARCTYRTHAAGLPSLRPCYACVWCVCSARPRCGGLGGDPRGRWALLRPRVVDAALHHLRWSIAPEALAGG
jgi:hypothetical protein